MELHSDGTDISLRFGVYVEGRYRYHAYNIKNTGIKENASLNDWDGYLLVGAYDGNGSINLWIDNRKSGSGGAFTEGVRNSTQPTLVGADPNAGASIGAGSFFNGYVQQATVLRWRGQLSDIVND